MGEAIGIAAAGIIVLLLLLWRNRPAAVGKWIGMGVLLLVVATFLTHRQLPEKVLAWDYFVGAIAFAVALVLISTVEQSPSVRAHSQPNELFNRKATLWSLTGGLMMGILGLLYQRWPMTIFGWAIVLGVLITLAWEKGHRTRGTS